MASDLNSFGEVTQALQGIRDQLSLHTKVFAASVVIGLSIIGFLYNKMDNVEDAVTRNTAILERIEVQMNKVVADAGAIRESVQAASLKPSRGVFEGYVGVSTGEVDAPQIYETLKNSTGDSEGWIFLPSE